MRCATAFDQILVGRCARLRCVVDGCRRCIVLSVPLAVLRVIVFGVLFCSVGLVARALVLYLYTSY